MKEKGRNQKRRRLSILLRRSFVGRTERRFMGHIRRALLAGVLLLVPLVLTYVVVRWLFVTLDGVLQPVVQWVLDRYGVDIGFAGLGLVLSMVLLYLAGLFFAFGPGRIAIGWGQALTLRIPIVGAIYSASRQFVESFSGSRVNETGFKRVVLIEYPRTGAWSVGFLTSLTHASEGLSLAVVYVPTAPLPNSGWVAIVPLDQVLDTDLTVPQAMRMVFSAGIVSPEHIKTSPLVLSDESILETLGMRNRLS